MIFFLTLTVHVMLLISSYRFVNLRIKYRLRTDRYATAKRFYHFTTIYFIRFCIFIMYCCSWTGQFIAHIYSNGIVFNPESNLSTLYLFLIDLAFSKFQKRYDILFKCYHIFIITLNYHILIIDILCIMNFIFFDGLNCEYI